MPYFRHHTPSFLPSSLGLCGCHSKCTPGYCCQCCWGRICNCLCYMHIWGMLMITFLHVPAGACRKINATKHPFIRCLSSILQPLPPTVIHMYTACNMYMTYTHTHPCTHTHSHTDCWYPALHWPHLLYHQEPKHTAFWGHYTLSLYPTLVQKL